HMNYCHRRVNELSFHLHWMILENYHLLWNTILSWKLMHLESTFTVYLNIVMKCLITWKLNNQDTRFGQIQPFLLIMVLKICNKEIVSGNFRHHKISLLENH